MRLEVAGKGERGREAGPRPAAAGRETPVGCGALPRPDGGGRLRVEALGRGRCAEGPPAEGRCCVELPRVPASRRPRPGLRRREPRSPLGPGTGWLRPRDVECLRAGTAPRNFSGTGLCQAHASVSAPAAGEVEADGAARASSSR